MINIIKFNSRYKKRLRILISIVFFIVLVIALILFVYHNNSLRRVVDKEAKATLNNVSSQNVISLDNEIQSGQKLLKSLASSIEKLQEYDISYILENIDDYRDAYGFYTMGVIDKNGICYNTLGEVLDLSNKDYFEEAMDGIAGITESYMTEDNSLRLNTYTQPIYKDGKVEMVLTATYKSSDFSEYLDITSFDGKGHSIVIDTVGNPVYMSNNTTDDQSNIVNELKENDEDGFRQLEADMKELKSGYLEYKYEGEEYLAYYEPLHINEWYLITYVPKDYIYQNADIINQNVLLVDIVMYAVLVLFTGIFLLFYGRYQNKISSIVFYDELTGEENAEYLKIQFDNMPSNEKENKSLIVLDIDKFKVINLMYGTEVGDHVLKYIARIFHEELPGDPIYKDRADLFIAILKHIGRDEIISKLQRVNDRIKRDIENKKIIPFEISIGVCSLEGGEDLHRIYSNALIAKSEIKGNVNQNFKFFDEQNKNKIIENRQFEAKFQEAIKNGEFEVWYQPKYDMRNNEVCGAEALIRWKKVNGSLISPVKFIPVFENNGQIIRLDEEVIRIVCMDMKEMMSKGYDVKPVSINLSRIHLKHPGIIEKIKEMIKEYEIDPSKIIFEITESAFLDDNRVLNKTVSDLHNLGFEVDIDDYGTGTSTLSSLSASNFDTLKLDKSFIDKIGDCRMDIIIKSTIAMANQLNMKVIAEGVETKEQVDFLTDNHCFIAQGYYYSKPVNKSEYISILSQRC